MSAGPASQRDAITEWIALAPLLDVVTVNVHAERSIDRTPNSVAIRLQYQPVERNRHGDHLLLRYAHRAVFFTDDIEASNAAQSSNEGAIIGRVKAVHVASFDVGSAPIIDDAALEAFADGDAYFIVYPYVRETLRRLSDQVGLPPVILPILQRSFEQAADSE